MANGPEHDNVLVRPVAVEDEGAVYMSIDADDKTYLDVEVVVLNMEERIRGQERIGWMNYSAFGHGEG